MSTMLAVLSQEMALAVIARGCFGFYLSILANGFFYLQVHGSQLALNPHSLE